MPLPRRLARRLRSAGALAVLGVLAPLGMLAASAVMLLDLRQDAWTRAEQTSLNLLQVVEMDIARNAEILDLTLRGVVDNLRAPGVAQADPALRQLILFDRAASARDLGVLLAIDENGEIVADAASVPPRRQNLADRDYFQAHKARKDLGLFIGHPLVSRLTGERMITFSRRIDKPDGSFGGVALATIKLSYFSRLFDRIGLGQEGAINLYLEDGTRVMRHPRVEADIGASIKGAPTFERFLREGKGAFVADSVRDGVERHYAFTRVGDLPLVLNVALATREIEAEWRGKALVIGAVVVLLCGLTAALSVLFGRELRRRAAMQAEMARLSRTDALTGLPNRRQFEEALARAAGDAGRTGRPLSLLVVDADHFKRYNDRYGHAVGDEVLKGLARALSGSVHRPPDLVCRIGGEEFVAILPGTGRDGALSVAERIHVEVSGIAVPGAGIRSGTVTVSVGLATASGPTDPGGLYRLADAALYEAKAGGRNQTRCAPQPAAAAPARPAAA